MSAPPITAAPVGQLRPVAWTRLAWVGWRRHRAMVTTTAALIALLASYLIMTGLHIRSTWKTVAACRPVHSGACQFAWQNFQNHDGNAGILSVVFIFAPLLMGAFAGAPLVSREFETGTFRFAWTQGAGRTRWAIAMLAPGAVAVALLSGTFGALVTWHQSPLWHADIISRLQADQFPATGVAVVGWALASYAVGVVAGLVLRRVVPALASTVALMFLLAFGVSRYRLHYLSPLQTRSLAHPVGSQSLDQWWDKGGVRVGSSQLNAVLRAGGVQQIQVGGGKTTVHPGPGQGQDPVTYLLQHGYSQVTSYQPSGRYWTFQWIELGWLTLLAAVLLTAVVLVLRTRDA